jgi:protein-L-isoaspartate(D-aspartate) O-methyltransferase
MEIDNVRTIQEREEMVRKQIISRNIKDERVTQALLKIPRHVFVPEFYRKYAYNDTPLVIGEGQTISQPYIVALMSELLEIQPTDRILEIGTGSGYQTAVCAELGKEVYTIERIEELAQKAEEVLESLEYRNIHFFVEKVFLQNGEIYQEQFQQQPYNSIFLVLIVKPPWLVFPTWQLPWLPQPFPNKIHQNLGWALG